MEPNVVVVNKKSRFATFVKVVLIFAAVTFVAVKIYNRFFKKKNVEELEFADEAKPIPEQTADTADSNVLEVPADAVIANPEEMEADL